MKKIIILFAIVVLTIYVNAQTKQQQIAAQKAIIENAKSQIEKARAAIEVLKMDHDSSVLINLDNLSAKKAIISAGKKDSDTFFYLNLGNKTSKISDLQVRMNIGGNYYLLKQCEDTVCVISEAENVITSKIIVR
jgi:3'-phosphoadenosine 5'-phosphosulfate sulfotransferase